MSKRFLLSESERKEIRKLYVEKNILSETVHTATAPLEHNLSSSQFDSVKNIMDLNIIVDDEVKGSIKCGEPKQFVHTVGWVGFNITANLNCENNLLEVSVDAADSVWSLGGGTRVVARLTEGSANSMSAAGVTINGQDPKNFSLSMTISQMKENPTLNPIEISVAGREEGQTTNDSTDETQTTNDNNDSTDETQTTNLSEECVTLIPQLIQTENVQKWIQKINGNAGWIVMKGSHGLETQELYKGVKDVIKIIQCVVGADVDGLFGPNTETKVKDYQRENNLTVDGKVGDETIGKMTQIQNTVNT
jgi:peptidoglycan hydrolase-like protein with peptidoglycan-binding domain